MCIRDRINEGHAHPVKLAHGLGIDAGATVNDDHNMRLVGLQDRPRRVGHPGREFVGKPCGDLIERRGHHAHRAKAVSLGGVVVVRKPLEPIPFLAPRRVDDGSDDERVMACLLYTSRCV